MKRTVLLIISLYLFSISGMAAQIHYCDGVFETFSIGFDNTQKCCCDKDEACNTCCKNESVKPDLSKHFSDQTQVVKPLNFKIFNQIFNSNIIVSLPFFKVEAISGRPFKDYILPVFIKNCVFRL